MFIYLSLFFVLYFVLFLILFLILNQLLDFLLFWFRVNTCIIIVTIDRKIYMLFRFIIVLRRACWIFIFNLWISLINLKVFLFSVLRILFFVGLSKLIILEHCWFRNLNFNFIVHFCFFFFFLFFFLLFLVLLVMMLLFHLLFFFMFVLFLNIWIQLQHSYLKLVRADAKIGVISTITANLNICLIFHIYFFSLFF